MLRVNRFIAIRRCSRFVSSSVVPAANPSSSTPPSSSVVTADGKPTPDENEPATPKKELIWALKKEKGQGLSTDGDTDADAGFEVLALMHKSNARFTIKHFRDVNETKPEAEVEDLEKHLKPQHR